ncbi:MAG: DUF364 domain-containing protein [Syntrophorhabdaceae bacterium]|nr:DUF364 domain-containing protein [Syntrophorhabdaceae bacterium]
MEILERIISRIDADAPVKEVRKGVFWTAVVSRFCGLSSTMLKEHCMDEDIDETVPASFTDMTALELARFSLSSDISKASLGLAAINSLIEVDELRSVEINAGNLLLKKGIDKNISVIGHFPFTNDLRNVAKNLWVIEKRQRPGDYPEDNAGQYLPRSDIVAISSTTLINHTLPGLLRLCPEKSVKMLLGPTTPMSPVLFDYGVDIISGSKVKDDEVALKHISEGANFRQLKRTGAIKLITMIRTGEYLV